MIPCQCLTWRLADSIKISKPTLEASFANRDQTRGIESYSEYMIPTPIHCVIFSANFFLDRIPLINMFSSSQCFISKPSLLFHRIWILSHCVTAFVVLTFLDQSVRFCLCFGFLRRGFYCCRPHLLPMDAYNVRDNHGLTCSDVQRDDRRKAS